MWFFKPKTFFLERLNHGADLLGSITKIFRQHPGQMGSFTAIGAVKKAHIAFYDQERKEYLDSVIDEPAEILSCVGNVSEVEGETSVHAHITLGYHDGTCRGGHLLEGTEVFACELSGLILEGEVLCREFDDVTGLKLWKREEQDPKTEV